MSEFQGFEIMLSFCRICQVESARSAFWDWSEKPCQFQFGGKCKLSGFVCLRLDNMLFLKLQTKAKKILNWRRSYFFLVKDSDSSAMFYSKRTLEGIFYVFLLFIFLNPMSTVPSNIFSIDLHQISKVATTSEDRKSPVCGRQWSDGANNQLD